MILYIEQKKVSAFNDTDFTDRQRLRIKFSKAIEINTKIIIFKNYESLTFITHFNPTAAAIAFHFFKSHRNSTFHREFHLRPNVIEQFYCISIFNHNFIGFSNEFCVALISFALVCFASPSRYDSSKGCAVHFFFS